ncbi:hypothetical protein CHGG_04891 [Chaetomium globosum CBS 148.51]|uniref:F-box domain-containing protein n=1 Tax=Chaetomium globosum (strain ATCC 6205 / CBS 148.51 / DSM 1962 / NBRC 6347 / NRRL 1970) TaxID=306901 RepID=Q2H005_CHAGB|nr:uncharacterized protein CHGG_04891 [Chaetomium globosum CBS 148.51]EAQ88272.1 hypothetical protein CHGG_04891 [Chaetomium globosum CBS 148.51]
MAFMAASPATQDALAGSTAPRPSNFMDLPHEVQREIISHCPRRVLICVALVSRHFRDLAAAQLYRDFEIVFPDEEDPQFDTPVDPLAGGFDTFVTSDYNYAQCLRSLTFDTLYMGDKAEGAYRPYSANLSCGKFMNTLLLLTLRKARALESFTWNIRVELSRPVYKELHQIASLSHVHVRLQAGPSQYETPPPLPYNPSQSSSPPGPAHGAPIASLPPPAPAFGLIPPPPPQGFYVPTSSMLPPPLPKPPRTRTAKKVAVGKEPPTLSGFRDLKSLSVLDIDTLDIVSELQACLRNSAGTLTKLELSFSEKLASSARKPTEPEPEDSDQEDELMPIPTQPHGQNDEMSGPAKAFRAQEERKTQDSILGRIFDVETTPAEKLQAIVVDSDKKKKGKIKTEQEVVDFIKSVAPKVLGELNGTSDFVASPETIDMFGAAARKYMDEAKSRKEKQAESSGGTGSSSSGTVETSDTSTTETSAEQVSADVRAEENAPEVSLFGEAKGEKKDADPDDIDIEAPEEQLTIDPEEPSAVDFQAEEEETTPTEVSPSTAAALVDTKAEEYAKVMATLESRKADFKALAEELELFESQANTLGKEIRRWRANKSSNDINHLREAESQLLGLTRSVRDMQKEISACQIAIESAEPGPPGEKDSRTEQARHIRDYIRQTRGVALESLSIYLIPVRASVLSKAVDLRALRHLTLLNVGIQAPIWALLDRENKEAPLLLRKISTDNVSHIFLSFVSTLEELHDLFLLEREIKAKPESLAPRTQVTMDQIRRLVLKKHMPKLRRLMIKNMADTSWDVDDKTVLLCCRQGKKLEELACSMSIRAMHCLMQHLPGLTTLRVLHVIHLRNDDTCMWVMRETKRFLIDIVSHYPDLKLKLVSIDEDDRVDKLVRFPEPKKTALEKEVGGGDGTTATKGKQKALTSIPTLISTLSVNALLDSTSGVELDVPALIASELGGMEEESSDEEDDESSGQKIAVFEGIAFCEVADEAVIFKKEVVTGRL